MKIRLGISTCPNDTFAFHALLEGLVDNRGLEFEIQLMDIQQLNQLLSAGAFDVAKASFHAAIKLAERMLVLPTGSALGFGVGPLLLSSAVGAMPTDQTQVTVCPGDDTTATLLFHLFYPDSTRLEQRVFSEIMPLLQSGYADFGVCIHEGRFTWQEQGLHLVEDLGTRWEKETGCPLPLGGILACRSLPTEVLIKVQQCVADSLAYARNCPEATLPTMRRHAQEFDDRVLMQHVHLYVNEWTVQLGDVGSRALAELTRRAHAAGILAADASLNVLEI